MKFPKLMVAVLTLCSFFTACDGKKETNSKTLTVGVSADYAPFEFFQEGKIVGFDIDLMNEIGKRLNKEIELKDMSFDAILGSLTTGKIDAAISSIEPTHQRRKSLDFSKEYIKSHRVLLCKGTSPLNTVSDLAEETIGVQAGSTHETYAKDTLSKDVHFTLKSLTKVPDLIQDMENGNLACLILGTPEAEAIKETKPNVKLLSLPGEVSGAAIALPKGSPLTQEINKILDEMEADGSLDKLKKHWLPQDSVTQEGIAGTPKDQTTSVQIDTSSTETSNPTVKVEENPSIKGETVLAEKTAGETHVKVEGHLESKPSKTP